MAAPGVQVFKLRKYEAERSRIVGGPTADQVTGNSPVYAYL